MKRTKKKSKKVRPQRTSKRFTIGRTSVRRNRLPINTQSTTLGSSSISYGVAPYHQTYGEGLRLTSHIRICDIIRGGSSDLHPFPAYQIFSRPSLGTSGYQSTVSCKSISSEMVLHDVEPGAAYYRGADTSIYCNGSHDGFNALGLIVRNYRKHATRKLTLHYLPAVSTTSNGSIALGVDFELGSSVPYSYQLVSQLPKAITFPNWQRTSFAVINDRDMKSQAIRLNDVSWYDSSKDTENSADLGYQYTIYGCLSGTVDSQSQETLGSLWADVVEDLYGLQSQDVATFKMITYDTVQKEEKKVAKTRFLDFEKHLEDKESSLTETKKTESYFVVDTKETSDKELKLVSKRLKQ